MVSKEINPQHINGPTTAQPKDRMPLEKSLRVRQPFLLPDDKTILLTGEERRILSQLIQGWREGEDSVANEDLMAPHIASGITILRANRRLHKTIHRLSRSMAQVDTTYTICNLTIPETKIQGIKGGYAFREKSIPKGPGNETDIYVKPVEAAGEDFVVLEDGTRLGLKPSEAAILQELIKKTKDGETMSHEDVRKAFVASGGNPKVSDGYVLRIMSRLRDKLEETDYDVINTNAADKNKRAAYVWGKRTEREEGKESDSMQDETDSLESERSYDSRREERGIKEAEKRKREEAERVKKQMPVYVANEIVLAIAQGRLHTLNRNVHILLEGALKQITSSHLTLAYVLLDMSIEEVKKYFITELDSQLKRGFNPDTDNRGSLSPKEIELIENCTQAKKLGHNSSRIINDARRHFEIPADIR